MQKLDTRIRAVLDTEKRAKDADDAFDALSGKKPAAGQAARTAGGSKMLDEVRKWARGDEGAGRALEIRRAPELGPINYRVLTAGTGGTASAIIPTDFYDMLIAHLIEVSGVMQCGPTVLNTGGGETLQVPKTTAHSTAASAAQAGTLPTSDPTFGMQPLSAFKYGIMLQVARELIDDTAVDLLGYLAMQAGRALGNAFGNDLVNGTGTGQPAGLVSTATVGVTGSVTGVAGAPSYANLVDLEYSVIAPYRQSRSCYWLAADKTIGGFRLLLDSQNRPIWEPSMVLGSPDLMLGKPLVADPFVPAVATSAKSVFFGDFAQYAVRLVGPVRFERSDDFAFQTDLVSFRAIIRGDGSLIDRTGACMKYYVGPAT